MKRLKATVLQQCLRKYEVRKPKPRAAMMVKSWRTAQGRGRAKNRRKQTREREYEVRSHRMAAARDI